MWYPWPTFSLCVERILFLCREQMAYSKTHQQDARMAGTTMLNIKKQHSINPYSIPSAFVGLRFSLESVRHGEKWALLCLTGPWSVGWELVKSEFSFSWISYFTKIRQLSLPNNSIHNLGKKNSCLSQGYNHKVKSTQHLEFKFSSLFFLMITTIRLT